MSEVPPGWQATKLKTLARLVTVKASDSSVKIGLEDLESWTGRLTPSGSLYEGEGIAFEPGDLLFGKLRPYLAKAWVADRHGAAVGDFLVIRPRKGVDGRFLRSVLLTPERVTEVSAAAYGAKMPRASWETVRDLELVHPGHRLQQQVVEFLDQETAEIDAFIEDQEELIGLLAERRAATIIHAVTNGLDPTVPTKDSGIAWLGAVPAQWTVARVKNAAEILAGYAFSSDAFSESEDSIPLLRGINVAVGFINWDESVGWDQPIDGQLASYHLRVGDIVVGLDRPVIAKGVRVARVRTQDVPSLLLQRVARLRATDGNSASFIEYALSSRMFADYLEPIFTGVSVPHISPTQLGNFPVALPDQEEQAAIARRLGEDVAEIDAAISDAREAIALSRERRAALISAAVTGKIDVRGAASPFHNRRIRASIVT